MNDLRFYEEIVRDSFGLWISGLFGAIGSWNPEMDFFQRKELFFFFVKDLLSRGVIKFIAPGADCYISPENPSPRYVISDENVYWKATPEEIVSYLKSLWPIGVSDENDIELAVYFYEIPGVVWIDENGDVFGS
ncbi:hypothetical protein GCM10007860_25970 [Chitiniphilus shinanonensis]|uniref:Uncharacterized protein n=1 Tax=Chitiniphilus shinanonensis TaxID=553088 RepID=A0ABQ6BUU7_9NEIS|nr:hypothetical protein [Chitiniphilus shinanonensis]GLS05444.1 hypothetical protein GCM10007860_25970 [Chitiniphilus shinanonensis]